MMMGINSPALALRKFNVTGAASKQEAPVIEIEGRKPGLIAFVLTMMGIDTTTSLLVTPRDIRFRKGSLYGEITSMMPMTAVASAHAGFAKPIGYLIAAGAIVLGSISGGVGAASQHGSGGAIVFLGGLVLAAIFVAAYFLSKKMAVFVESSGGTTFGLVFKPSVIEGVTVDIEKVKTVVDMIRELVITCQQRAS
jgi:hypothetical protein